MENEQRPVLLNAKRKRRARAALATSTIFMALMGIALLTANITGSLKLVSVLSDSMEPTIDRGSLVLVQDVSPEKIKPGDVVAIGLGSIADTRISRISSIESSANVHSYTLWADNTPMQDPWLHRTMSDLQLVVWSAPYLGWVLVVISNPFFVALMVVASIVFAYYYTMKIFQYNKRQVYARRIAEERLENIKYGGVDDIVDLFEEKGGVLVKVGKKKEVVATVDELNQLVKECQQEQRERIEKKLMKKYANVEKVNDDQ